MARNFKQEGNFLDLPAPYNRTSGQGALIGRIFGVATVDVLSTVVASFARFGVWTLTKTEAQAWTVGIVLFWDDAAKEVTSVATAGLPIGIAMNAAANPSTTGDVLLVPGMAAALEGAQAAVTALTDNTGAGANDSTIADGLTATAPAAITNYAAVVNMTDPVTKAEGEAVSAALAVLENEVTALRATVALLVTDVTTQNQNDSDLAAKINAIRAALVAAGIIAA